jgi:hypothetical protein
MAFSHDIIVEAAFGDTMLTASPTWTDISTYVRPPLTIVRGRPSIEGRFATGTATVVLDNRDGDFNPENSAGAFFPDVRIGTPIRISVEEDAVNYPLFLGSARAWPPDYPRSQDSTVTVPLADGFHTLNLEDLAGETYPEQDTDERLDAVLDDVGWPAGLRDFDAPLGFVQATAFAQPGDGREQPALNHLLDVAESEAGVLFMSPAGEVVFRNRIANSGASPAFTFTSDDIHALSLAYNDDFLWNVIRVAREDGLQVEVDESGTSPRRVLTRDVMPMGNDAQVLNVAEWLAGIFGDQRLRVDQLTLKPLRYLTTVFPAIMGLELRDMITVQHDPPGAGDTIDQDCAVEVITHAIGRGDWTTTLSVVPLSTFESQEYWILGTSELGVSTRLA